WSKTNASLVTTHSVTLTGLTADMQYYFRVGSTDGFENGPTTSNEVTFTTESASDIIPPRITIPPTVTGITQNTAVIEWQTDEPSNSVVDYGETATYDSQATLADYVTNHSVTLSGLSPGNDYNFRVGSTDAAANGPTYSNNNTFTTKIADDRAPEIISPPTVTNITDSTAIITWQTDEPSNSMVRYDAQTRAAWGDYLSSEDDAGMVTSHSVTLTGLQQNKPYWFMAGSTDAFGNGPDTSDTDNNPSAQQYFSTKSTPDTAAPVISNVIVAGTTDTTAIIQWRTDEPSNSMVQYGTSSSIWGNYLWSENDAGMVTNHSVTLTGLTGGGTYYFRVGSADASSNGPDLNSNATNPSAQQSLTTDVTPDTAAPVISDVDVPSASITNTNAIITWTTDEPCNSKVQYGFESGSYTIVESDAEMVTSHSVTITNLGDVDEGTSGLFPVYNPPDEVDFDANGNGTFDPTITYYFIVTSTDASFNTSSPSAQLSFTTTVPDTTAPEIRDMSVVSITDTTATITWTTDELSNTMVRYDTVSRSTWTGYQWSKNDSKIGTSHTITLTGLIKGTPYYFRVGSNDALGNGPDLNAGPSNPYPNPPDNDIVFTTTNTDTDPPSILGYSIDYVNDTIDVTYDEANMQNANIEANYSFSPALSFRTAGGSDDITYIGSNTYRLFMSIIPENTIFTLRVTGITDEAGNPVPYDPPTAIDIPPAAVGIAEVIPHNNAGITDSTRIPNNTSFAARIEDSDGIDTTDLESITFTIDDGVNLVYDYNLGNSDVVRVVQLDPNETEDNVTKLWAVYDKSMDYTYGNLYSFGETITISVDAKDRNGDWMDQGVYSFKVETEAQHDYAENNLPPTGVVDPNDPDLEGSYIYDTGAQLSSGQLNGAKILYDSYEPITPIFGPIGEIPALNISGVDAVGVPMNLQPPTVFNTPVKIFIPCPGYQYASTLSVYRYTGASWVLACNASGTVQAGGEGWMVPGSRVDHNLGSPSTIEIQVYHFTGVQAGSPSGSGGRSTDDVAGGGCFIATAAYGSNMDKHVKILSEFKDKRLVTNPIGRSIVDAYYKFSPPVANYLQKHPSARAVVRYALIPITGIAYISLSIHPLALLFAFIFMLLTGVYCFKRLAIRRQRSAM
ncbi:MAG TPA: fibronectin type III domain-containing protein, partial [Desulfatiglandales bacterium]|nr:fibronectin type III domain-containing protein [Desulfatiglandales bacterium]